VRRRNVQTGRAPSPRNKQANLPVTLSSSAFKSFDVEFKSFAPPFLPHELQTGAGKTTKTTQHFPIYLLFFLPLPKILIQITHEKIISFYDYVCIDGNFRGKCTGGKYESADRYRSEQSQLAGESRRPENDS
jgi:hypothetical protein